jgi:N-acetyl-anhydromuramyl-L-alanine amidase AmpD
MLAAAAMRSLRWFAFAPLAALLVLPACSPQRSSFDGPVGRLVVASADRSRVPADLMAAVAHVEGGFALALVREVHDDEAVPVAGVLELRRGRFDSLARGAALMGTSERAIIRDLALGTEAGARVLAELAASRGVDRADLSTWAPAIEELSGHLLERDRVDYRARVFRFLRAGGEARTASGETIVIAAHDEIPVALTIPPPALSPEGAPEYAGATWFDTPQASKWTPGRGGNPVTMIAVHDTEGGWDASVATLQNDTGKSVHYIIDADGSRVGQFVSEADTAWHVGNWYYNQHMVGIEHVGYASAEYQTAIYETSAKLVRDIAARHGLGPKGDGSSLDRSVMVGHQEVPDGNVIPEDSPPCPDSPGSCVKSDSYGGASNHRDPGVHWEWCQYMEIIGGGAHCKCNDAYGHFNCVHDLSEKVRCSDGTNVEIVHCASNSCIVQPLGVDDVCGQDAIPGAGGAGASAGGAGGSPRGAAGSGGGRHDQPSGCAVSGAPADRSALAIGSALVVLAIRARRRRR